MAIKCYICGTDHKDMEEVILHHPEIKPDEHAINDSEALGYFLSHLLMTGGDMTSEWEFQTIEWRAASGHEKQKES